MQPLDDLPNSLAELVSGLDTAIASLTGQLRDGELTSQAWFDEMSRTLVRYHMAAFFVGDGSDRIPEQYGKRFRSMIAGELDYLRGFTAVIEDAAEWQRGFEARASLYAGKIKEPYWEGRTKLLPLPAMPGDGTTQCKTHCQCSWRIEVIDKDRGDYDCYWVRGAADSCQTCVSRAISWNPYRVRGGRVDLDDVDFEDPNA